MSDVKELAFHSGFAHYYSNIYLILLFNNICYHCNIFVEQLQVAKKKLSNLSKIQGFSLLQQVSVHFPGLEY